MAERRIAFSVEITVEDTETETTEAPTETDMQDWMMNAPMMWSEKGINATDVVVSIDYDSADDEPWEDEDE